MAGVALPHGYLLKVPEHFKPLLTPLENTAPRIPPLAGKDLPQIEPNASTHSGRAENDMLKSMERGKDLHHHHELRHAQGTPPHAVIAPKRQADSLQVSNVAEHGGAPRSASRPVPSSSSCLERRSCHRCARCDHGRCGNRCGGAALLSRRHSNSRQLHTGGDTV